MKKKSLSFFDVFNILFLGSLSLLCILPFINLLAISFSNSTSVAAGHVKFIPVGFTLASYEYAFRDGGFVAALWISLKRVFLGVSINMILMVLTAYPLSKTKQQVMGRHWYMGFFLVTMLVSGGMIPTYLVVVKAGLKDTLWSLVLPGGLPVYNMLILMNFMRNIPDEMEEAAAIDGASPFVILLKIILPVLKPALATVGLFCIVGHWNEWFNGMIYMNSTDNYPLQTYLNNLLANFEQMLQRNSSSYMEILALMNVRTGRAAQLFLAALPIMCIYPFLQKYFTKGLVLGSVKG